MINYSLLLFMYIFEIVGVISILCGCSLTTLSICFFVILGFIVFFLLKKKKWFFENGYLRREKTEKTKDIYFLICMFMIMVQVAIVIFFQHMDADDAMYLGISATAYATDELYTIFPYTGVPTVYSDFRLKDYTLSPFPLLWSMFAKLFRISPTIIAHTFVPPFVILWAYWVYYQLGLKLFTKEKYAWIFVLFINILNVFGYYSARIPGIFLLFRPWQGKAFFAAIMVPLLFYYFLMFLEEKESKAGIVGIYLTMGAGCLVSFSAVVMMPLLLGAMALTYLIVKKNFTKTLWISGAVLPNVILVIMYSIVL